MGRSLPIGRAASPALGRLSAAAGGRGPSLGPINSSGHADRRARRRRVGVGAQGAAGAADGTAEGQQGKWQPPKREPMGQRALTTILNTTNIPCGSYIPEPRTFLHDVDARVKQVWLVALMFCLARSTVPVRISITIMIGLMTIALLPTRTWKQQLKPLLVLCALMFLGTALGADGVPPVTTPRVPPPSAEGLVLDPSLLPGYSYVVAKLGPLTITKKSLNLAVSSVCLTFSVIQSASLALLTTPEESMARALGWFMAPLRWIGVPVKEMVLTLLLSLRFMSLVFEEMRNIALGLAARDIQWDKLKFSGSMEVVVSMAGRLMSNLFLHAEKIALAMRARGFEGVEKHRIHPTEGRTRSVWPNVIAIVFLAAWLPSVVV